jgi:hypothetical protein
LHAERIHVVMLTGDSRTTAQAVGRKLGIDDVVAEVLPDQKASAVKKFQDKHRFVAMAGDGINDAPALAQAQVGIAMGTGADVAMESAAVTLIKGDLQGIVRARHLSRATMRNIRQNLFFAFVFNVLAVPIAAGILYPALGLLLNPMIASAAMSMSSVLVVTNALRLAPSHRPAMSRRGAKESAERDIQSRSIRENCPVLRFDRFAVRVEALPRVAAAALSRAFRATAGGGCRDRSEFPVLSDGRQLCCRDRPQSAHVGARGATARPVACPDRAEADGRNKSRFCQQYIRCGRLDVPLLRSSRSPAGAGFARTR